MKKWFVLPIMALFLSACTSYFGLSQEEWDSLTPAQKSEVIKAYNEREAQRQQAENEKEIIAEQNAPLNNLIGALGAAIPQKGKEKSTTTESMSCNADGTHCTSEKTTRTKGWSIGS